MNFGDFVLKLKVKIAPCILKAETNLHKNLAEHDGASWIKHD